MLLSQNIIDYIDQYIGGLWAWDLEYGLCGHNVTCPSLHTRFALGLLGSWITICSSLGQQLLQHGQQRES